MPEGTESGRVACGLLGRAALWGIGIQADLTGSMVGGVPPGALRGGEQGGRLVRARAENWRQAGKTDRASSHAAR